MPLNLTEKQQEKVGEALDQAKKDRDNLVRSLLDAGLTHEEVSYLLMKMMRFYAISRQMVSIISRR